MIPILTVVHNNFSQTKSALQSMLSQVVRRSSKNGNGYIAPVVVVVANECDPTLVQWIRAYSLNLERQRARGEHSPLLFVLPVRLQRSVAHAWNLGLSFLWDSLRVHVPVLVCNNDIILAHDTYDSIYGVMTKAVIEDYAVTIPPILTGVGVSDPVHMRTREKEREVYGRDNLHTTLRPHPDFSCFMLDRETYTHLGPFDEEYKIAFCEDNDYHVRATLKRVYAGAIDVPFLHHDGGSQTIKHMSDTEQAAVRMQADLNRERFAKRYGFEVGSEGYVRFFAEAEVPQPLTDPRAEPLTDSGVRTAADPHARAPQAPQSSPVGLTKPDPRSTPH